MLSKRLLQFGNFSEENKLTSIKKNLEERNVPFLDLTSSNPTNLGLEFPDPILRHLLESVNLSHYNPEVKGLESARNSISNFYAERGYTVSKESIYLTPSTSDSYSYLFKLLTNPGDEVLTPSPGYPLFSYLSSMENLNEIHYPLVKRDAVWEYDVESILNVTSTKTKIICLVSPANPTGSQLNKNFWLEWKESRCQIPILIDEVFYGYDGSDEFQDRQTFPTDADFPLFILNGISKMFCLPNWKLGWILSANSDHRLENGLELILDTYLSTNTIIQSILPQIFQWKPMIQNKTKTRIQRNFRIASDLLSDSKYQVLPYQGGWFLVLKLPELANDELFCETLLEKKAVLIYPGKWFGFSHNESYGIISLITEEETFRLGIEKILVFNQIV
ncbi:MAG: pyridoxal phosphate-dependent aminotransferase [Leptospira sp.]|nr:pyridoxal phosphate-dependent aminotransferase [Leptospira sp.]